MKRNLFFFFLCLFVFWHYKEIMKWSYPKKGLMNIFGDICFTVVFNLKRLPNWTSLGLISILGEYIYFKWRDRLESKIFYAVLILTTGYSLFLFLTGAIRWLLKISILMCWSLYQLTCKIWKTLQFAYSKVFFPFNPISLLHLLHRYYSMQ